MPPILLQTMAWSLGEYAYLLEETIPLSSVCDKLCTLARRPVIDAPSRRYLIHAVFKLVAQLGTCPGKAAHLIDDFTKSRDPILQQSCGEFQNLITTFNQILGDVFPVDASCEDVGVDESLSLMNDYVQKAIASGANVYSPPADVSDDEDGGGGGGDGRVDKPVFNMTPYEKPPTNPHQQMAMAGNGGSLSVNNGMNSTGTEGSVSSDGAGGQNGIPGGVDRVSEVGLRLSGVANVWGPEMTVKKNEPPTRAPTPAPAPAVVEMTIVVEPEVVEQEARKSEERRQRM